MEWRIDKVDFELSEYLFLKTILLFGYKYLFRQEILLPDSEHCIFFDHFWVVKLFKKKINLMRNFPIFIKSAGSRGGKENRKSKF